jgi:hypothetical protein
MKEVFPYEKSMELLRGVAQKYLDLAKIQQSGGMI